MDQPRRVFAIDWSGALIGSHKRIWLAEADERGLVRLECGRTAVGIVSELLERASEDSRFVVGLDFAFSFPAWYLDHLGIRSARELWERVEREGEDWLRDCSAPFWGRPGRARPSGAASLGYRQAELKLRETTGRMPKSVFQIGGAGSVGTGSVRGMPVLRSLQDAGFSVWPFDPPKLPLLVEIYPRVHTGPVVKSNLAARSTCLAKQIPSLPPGLRLRAEGSDDAFDAAISALAMMDAVDGFSRLEQATCEPESREGAIWSAARATPKGTEERIDRALTQGH